MNLETLLKDYEAREERLKAEAALLPIPLWKHQEEAIRRAKDLNYFGLFFEVGTGKTRTIIEILEDKYKKHRRVLKTLILCPLIVVINFKREFEKFGKINKKIIALEGPIKKRIKTFKENPESVFITNYEILYNLEIKNAIRAWRPEVFVADELHKLKDPKAKRTKAASEIADMAMYRYGLSGTPILNTQLDLFSQVRILDRGETFGNNFSVFRARYFYDANAARKGTHTYFPNWLPKPGIDSELRRLISPFSMSVKKEECLDLPPLIKKEVLVEMGSQQLKAYTQMKKDFITFIKDKACVAELAITKALRLQQIVSGYIRTEEEIDITFDEIPRLEVLEKLVTDIIPTAKVIIWANFIKNYHMIERILENNKIKYTTLTGETKNRQEEVDKFQEDDSVRVMIANPAAGGIGINLTKASYMIYYSRSFNLEHEIQSEARCYRGGSEQHEKITRIDIITKDSIDDIISKVLEEKKKIGDNVLTNQDIIGILKREL